MNFLVISSSAATGAAGGTVRMPLLAAGTSCNIIVPGLGGRKPLAAGRRELVNPQARRTAKGNERALFQAQCLSCCQSKGG